MTSLIIGNKTYSSWSLRPWLLLKQFGIDFDEIVLPLDTDQFRAEIHHHSPSGRVPALRDGEVIIWDSLAICEYVNERYLNLSGWPTQLQPRAVARAYAAEMHSGFAAMRNELPMNVLRIQRPRAALSEDALRDIARVHEIWRECRSSAKDGPFLTGPFSILDAMFAPVVYRFRGYGIALDAVCQAYSDAVLALPALAEWERSAAQEAPMAKYENVQ